MILLTTIIAVSETSSDTNWTLIGLLFFLSGFIFYALMFMRYRNVNKRYHHESKTRSELKNLTSHDQLARSMTGLNNSRMRDANHRQVSGALNSFSGIPGRSEGNVKRIVDGVNRFRPR